MKFYTLDTIFDFGMHKGKTLKQVLEYSGAEKFDFPELKDKPKPKHQKLRKKGEKLVLSTPEEIKHILNGISLETNPSGMKYINWCIINISDFFIGKVIISELKKNDPTFYLTNEAEESLEEKFEEWNEERTWNQRNHFDYEDFSCEDNQYCGACMESPCMCSDPEKTSTTYGY
jgi:hypothetical protein